MITILHTSCTPITTQPHLLFFQRSKVKKNRKENCKKEEKKNSHSLPFPDHVFLSFISMWMFFVPTRLNHIISTPGDKSLKLKPDIFAIFSPSFSFTVGFCSPFFFVFLAGNGVFISLQFISSRSERNKSAPIRLFFRSVGRRLFCQG